MQGKVVMCLLLRLGESWQGRQLARDKIGNALWQRQIVEVSADADIAKVTMHGCVVLIAVVARLYVKLL